MASGTALPAVSILFIRLYHVLFRHGKSAVWNRDRTLRHAGDLCPIEEESVCQVHDLGKLDQAEGEKTLGLDSCCQAEALESNNVSGGVLGVRSTTIMRRFAPPI